MKDNQNDLFSAYDIDDPFREADVDEQMMEIERFEERQKLAKSGMSFDMKSVQKSNSKKP